MTKIQDACNHSMKRQENGPLLVAQGILHSALALAGQDGGIERIAFREQMRSWGSDAADLVLKSCSDLFAASPQFIALTDLGRERLKTTNELVRARSVGFDFRPPIGTRVCVEVGDEVLSGVVTGHDSKDAKPVIGYEHEHVMPDGSVAKAHKWAWLDQILSMDF